MKKGTLFAAALGFSLALSAQKTETPAGSLSIGSSLPASRERFLSTDQKAYSLGDQATKKGLIVMFSCNTCPYVIKSQERTKEVMELARDKGLGMVIVNSNTAQRDDADSYEAMKKYAQQQGYTVPYITDDGRLAEVFGATRTPEVFLFDQHHKLVYKGAMEDNPSKPSESKQLYLRDAVENMMAGKPVAPNSTKSIGCTIKR